jgi:hypothetical protein
MLFIIAIIVGVLAAGAGLWGFAFAALAFAVIMRWLFAFLLPAFIILLILALVLELPSSTMPDPPHGAEIPFPTDKEENERRGN